MNRAALRRFEFFDVETIAEDICNTLGCVPTCGVAEGGMLIFGDDMGNIIFADQDFRVSDRRAKIFKGKVKALTYLLDQRSNKQYIVALGDDYRTGEPPLQAIKVYSSSDFTRPLNLINVTSGDASVTAYAVTSDGNEVAVGYSSGRVLLFLCPLLNEPSQSRNALPSPVILLERHSSPVSSLHFCEVSNSKGALDEHLARLFITLDTKQSNMESEAELMANTLQEEDIEHAGIVVFDTSYTTARHTLVFSPSHPPKALDSRGAPSSSVSFMKLTSELLVAREEAVCTYTVDDRGGAMAVLGEKVSLSAVGRYALLVSIEDKANTSGKKKPQVNVYDLKNKIICGTFKRYQLPASERILFLLHDGGVVYLLTTSYTFIRFREKDTAKKLDILLNQVDPPLYSLSITVAQEEQLEAKEVMKLFKMYGDYLYGKYDYDQAVVQYSQTIGYLPTSYVIIKYLDPYRMSNLVTYLEKVRDKGLATSEHVTLLLTCYCKLKAPLSIQTLLEGVHATHQRLSSSLSSTLSSSALAQPLSSSPSNKAPAPLFDAPSAIKLLSGAGYSDLAQQVALRFHQPRRYLSLCLSSLPPKYDQALGYLLYLSLLPPSSPASPSPSSSLSPTSPFSPPLLSLLQQVGRELFVHRGEAFTQVILSIVCGEVPAQLNNYLLSLKASPSPAPPSSLSLPVEVVRSLHSLLSFTSEGEGGLEERLSSLSSASSTLSSSLDPSLFLSLFVHDATSTFLLSYCEQVIGKLSKTRLLSPKLYNTTLEVYLSSLQTLHRSLAQNNNLTAGERAGLESQARSLESRILGLLESPHSHYSPSLLYLYATLSGHSPTFCFLLEKSAQHAYLLLEKYLEAGKEREVFKLVRRMHHKPPELITQVLTHFVKRLERKQGGEGEEGEEEEEDESRYDLLVDLLDLIDKEAVLSPAQVLSILSLHPHLPLRIAAPYLRSTLQDLQDSLSLSEGTVQGAWQQLEASALIAQDQGAGPAGAGAGGAGGLGQGQGKVGQGRKKEPRSYYEEDESDEDDEEEDRRRSEETDKNKWQMIRTAQLLRADQHEEFFRTLETSADGFSTVANYFGLTVINYTS